VRARDEADSIVAALYGVTPAEHRLLDSFVHRRLGFVVNDD
jgi:hypothetical protein